LADIIASTGVKIASKKTMTPTVIAYPTGYVILQAALKEIGTIGSTTNPMYARTRSARNMLFLKKNRTNIVALSDV